MPAERLTQPQPMSASLRAEADLYADYETEHADLLRAAADAFDRLSAENERLRREPDNGYGVEPSAVITSVLAPRSFGMGQAEDLARLILDGFRDAGFTLRAADVTPQPPADPLEFCTVCSATEDAHDGVRFIHPFSVDRATGVPEDERGGET